MIKLSLISSTLTNGLGTNVYGSCIEVPVIYGATASQPQVSASFATGTAFISGSVTIIPCTATISIKYIDSNSGLVVRQQELVEHFTLGANVATIPGTITLTNLGYQTTYTKTKCCKSYGMRLDGAFSLTTAA